MSKSDLKKFIDKIYQLNLLREFIDKNPTKRKELSDCSNHDEVIKLTTEWGFDIGKRWGEY